MHAHNRVAALAQCALPEKTITELERRVRELCHRYADRLPFHGWHHVSFVRAKAVAFAQHNGADRTVVEVAALVHDVNYLVRRNSPAAAGRQVRLELLTECGVEERVARWIDEIVDEAEMATRDRYISLEAQALSDADTLFKQVHDLSDRDKLGPLL